MKDRNTIVLGAVVAFCLATAVCFVSNNLNARVQHRSEVIDQQFALLERRELVFDGRLTDLPEFRNRLLFPAMLKAVVATGVATPSQAFLALRVATATACLFGVWLFAVAVAGATVESAMLALSLMGWCLVLSFNHPWEHPSDFLDVIVTTGWITTVLCRHFALTLLVVIAGTLNRESTAFAGVLWAVLWGTTARSWGERFFAGARGAALACSALATTALWRWLFGVHSGPMHNSVAVVDLPGAVQAALERPGLSWLHLVLTAFTLPAVWLWTMRGNIRLTDRAVVSSAVAVAGLSAVIGRANEIRIFLPALTMLVLAGVLRAGHVSRVDDSLSMRAR
jgi:hypothetical protein